MTSNVLPSPAPAGWHTVPAAFRTCYALGWSPVPLIPESKRPPFKSWPGRCIVPLTGEEMQRVYRPGHELGVACGYGGLVVLDVDAGPDAARELMHQFLGPPLAVVAGARGFKGIYRGPWAPPPPDLVAAAINYNVAGEALARADGQSARARRDFVTDNVATISAEQARAAAERARDRVKTIFDQVQDEFIERHQLIRSADVSNGTVAVQILSFGRIAVLPPSRHPRSPTGHYRWEGDPPTHKQWNGNDD